MADENAVPDAEKALKTLDRMWKEVLASDTPEEDDPRITALVNSSYVSIRYCLPTQILGSWSGRCWTVFASKRALPAKAVSGTREVSVPRR